MTAAAVLKMRTRNWTFPALPSMSCQYYKIPTQYFKNLVVFIKYFFLLYTIIVEYSALDMYFQMFLFCKWHAEAIKKLLKCVKIGRSVMLSGELNSVFLSVSFKTIRCRSAESLRRTNSTQVSADLFRFALWCIPICVILTSIHVSQTGLNCNTGASSIYPFPSITFEKDMNNI